MYPGRAAHGGGAIPAPRGLFLRANKRAVQVVCNSLHSPKAHKPIFQRISLVKGEESLYNGCGAVLLLCGRRFLLHRGVGCSRTSRPALIIRLDAILAHIPLECKRFFRTLHCSGPLFLLFRGWWCWSSSAGWPATDGAGVLAEDGSKAENKVGSAPYNSPPWGWW